MKVFTVGRHMRGQLSDSLGKQGYLHIGRTGIAFLCPVIADNLGLFLFIQVIPLPPNII
jgi:hypothetical protein